jgi:hypothetical protein
MEPGRIPFDQNRIRVSAGISDSGPETILPLEVNANGGLDVNLIGSVSGTGAVVAGQQAVTGTAAALPAAALTTGVIITGLSTNTISVFIGPIGVTTSTGAEIQPGAALSVATPNLDNLYVVASTTGATVTWIGS